MRRQSAEHPLLLIAVREGPQRVHAVRLQKLGRRGVAEDARQRRIDIKELAVQPGDKNALAGILEQRAVFLLTVAQTVIKAVQLFLHAVADLDQMPHMAQQPGILTGQPGECGFRLRRQPTGAE